MASLFNIIPDNFFSPLVFSSRVHFSELLSIYYKKFLIFPVGIEKAGLLQDFEDYFENLTDDIISSFENDTEDNETADVIYEKTSRGYAARFLRRLVKCGWMSEEIEPDFTVKINITDFARPFYEAISRLIEGETVEYESHVINIYSSLCNDAVYENGHLSVMNAFNETRRLVDSLKVLSQNIKTYIQELYDHSGDVRDILHIHYDLYMGQIIDKAYNRMKTSDNLSKYRPRIISSIESLKKNDEWIFRFGKKYADIKNINDDAGRITLLRMLNEIKNDLRSLDPLIDDIDDKNRRYSGISTEKIRTRLYTDESLEGKIRKIVNSLENRKINPEDIDLNLLKLYFMNNNSFYNRKNKIKKKHLVSIVPENSFEQEIAEEELRLRIARQLNPEKISVFLDEKFFENITRAEDIAVDMESFVKLLYASVYAESRLFPYFVKWGDAIIEKGRFKFKEHWFERNEKFIKRY